MNADLTKRELFAAMFLQQLMSLKIEAHEMSDVPIVDGLYKIGEYRSAQAVSWADALIAELEKIP